MIQEYSRYKILQAFFDFPRRNLQVREISRLIGLAQPSVVLHLARLAKEGFVIREKKSIYFSYRANRDNEMFKLYKKMFLFVRLEECGLLDYVYDSCMPDSIILFGSASKGEDIEESDIDIFVQAREKKTNLDKYEKILNRKITLFFKEDFSKLSNELKNNILNGQVLRGYLKVF
jgi:predicted nucleotidyltransferase